ncbi:phosphate-binding protein [Mycobacterium kyorinense]|uniref:Phosphate-binding protein n=1 Tax=Mycobacterium kyorinense TaxID=487514 RepID=A0A1X1Y256_9MYCO|nr:phosphate-binding protein [Mycobacterium kyorinense]
MSTAAIMCLLVTACARDGIRHTMPTPAGVSVDCDGKKRVTAEGSTAQRNAIALFSQRWAQVCPGKGLSYNPTGSGAGREQFIAGHVDFAGSDSPLTTQQTDPAAKRCNGNPAWDLPLVFGPIALAYNVGGLKTLVLSGDVLARIYSGDIRSWNDPAITALNPGSTLPDLKIRPIYRSDSSGTTDNFQRYLAVAAPNSWRKGAGTDFRGGVGEGAERSSGLIAAVQATPGAIGYVEEGYAAQADLPFAGINTGSGAVPLADDTVRKAIDAAKFSADGNDLRLDLDSLYSTKEPGAYPLVLASYEIVCSKGYQHDTAAAVKSFLAVAANDARDALSAAGYIPLPGRFKQRLVAAIEAIQ